MQVISIFQEMSDANNCYSYSDGMSWILIVENESWEVSGEIASGEGKQIQNQCRGSVNTQQVHAQT